MAFLASLASVLTFALGTATAVAFFLVGSQLALNGTYVVTRSWPSIYSLEALFVGAIMFVITRLLRDRLSSRRLLAMVLAAWLGQYLVLASGLLADELNPMNALGYWLLATGGPLQPAAAFIGGWFGLRPRGGRAGAGASRDQ
jgi:hypothetical protein